MYSLQLPQLLVRSVWLLLLIVINYSYNNISEIKADSIITLTSSPGRIIAPDSVSRGLYDDNVDKLWIIDAPEGQIILFHLHFAQIRYSVNCYEDGLRVGGNHLKQ